MSDPLIRGPLVGPGRAVGAPRAEVADRGFVVEEHLLAGVAVAYASVGGVRPAADGRWAIEAVATGDFVTRLLVVRPPARSFNGTVLVNWQNVSAGAEARAPSSGEIYDGGYAWVGVSAQEVGIHGFGGLAGRRTAGGSAQPLKQAEPERYADLFHPGDRGSFSIFHQAARALGPQRHHQSDPLGGLPVERVVAVGGSQSAMRLVAYANGLHAIEPVVDGFVLGLWEGMAPRYEDGSMPSPWVTRVRDDLETPMIVVNSEFEARRLVDAEVVDTGTLRVWEVAGAPHASAPILRDSGDWTANPLSVTPVHHAALRAMHRWLVDGDAPTHQPRIEVSTNGLRAVVRDEVGNARGGIRLPELAAPLREYRGMAFGTGEPPLMGSSRALAPATVRERYSTQAEYAVVWDRAVDALVADGVVRPEDERAIKERVPTLPPSSKP